MKALTAVLLLSAVPAFAQVEGYGASATGGSGGSVCTVTNAASTGAGTFSDCARRGNVIVQFAGPGPYTVDGQNTYLRSNTTIDGCANGQNGVTLDQKSDIYRGVILEGPASNLVVRCIRFQGKAKSASGATEHDLLGLDGTGGAITKVSVDRCTFTEATDGALDITGDVSDVTVQRSLFYNNPLTQLIKYDLSGKFPRNLSLHHNVYTGNGERNPQIRGGASVDMRSNVVGPTKTIVDFENGQPYSMFGSFLWNSTTSGEGTGNVKANVTDSAFLGSYDSGPKVCAGSFGITICTDSGASAAGIYLSGNSCSAGACPASPASAPNPSAPVTITPVSGLRAYLANVGAPNRTAEDQTALDKVSLLLPGPGPTPTPTPVPTPTPTPQPTPTPTPVPTPTPTPTPCPTCPTVTLSTVCGNTITDSNVAGGKKRRRVVTTCDTVYP